MVVATGDRVTLDIEADGTYVVHAIDQGSADGLLEGTMQKKVAHAFGEPGPGETPPPPAPPASPDADDTSKPAEDPGVPGDEGNV